MNNILSVSKLLDIEGLIIPKYQRPYKWNSESVTTLLNDIYDSILKHDKNINYKYRLGNIIIYDNGNVKEIVDGQQRIITLLLLEKYISKEVKATFNSPLLNQEFSDNITIRNIYNNYKVIENWFNMMTENKLVNKMLYALKNIVEVVVIGVDNSDNAFQLFDSQNSRGKSLYPHDVLKAYHLRKMKGISNKKINVRVNNWENTDSKEIAKLFDYYLYPTSNWLKDTDNHKFTIKDINDFKGLDKCWYSKYRYTKLVKTNIDKKKHYYSLTTPFIAGDNFFEMVFYYDDKINFIKKRTVNILNSMLKEDTHKEFITNIILEKNYLYSIGWYYVSRLFICALLAYCDKFGYRIDPLENKKVVVKLFVWAFMLRIDLDMVNQESINRYALGGYEDNIGNYSNNINMFQIIKNAYEPSDIYKQIIVYQTNRNEKLDDDQNMLLEIINVINNNVGDIND